MRHPLQHLSRATALAASLAFASALLPAQADAGAPKIQHDANTITLPVGDLPLQAVVDAAAAFLKVNILYNRAEIQAQGGTIFLQTPMTLARDKAEAAISDLVYTNGFVLAPRDADQAVYELVHLRGPKAREAMQMAPQRTAEQVLSRPTLKQPVQTSLTLQNTNATIAINALRPFYAATSGGPTNMTFGCADNHTMLLSGIQCEVAKAIELLRKVDVKSEDADAVGATPDDLPTKNLLRRVAKLEHTVQQLQKEVAELQQRIEAGK